MAIENNWKSFSKETLKKPYGSMTMSLFKLFEKNGSFWFISSFIMIMRVALMLKRALFMYKRKIIIFNEKIFKFL